MAGLIEDRMRLLANRFPLSQPSPKQVLLGRLLHAVVEPFILPVGLVVEIAERPNLLPGPLDLTIKPDELAFQIGIIHLGKVIILVYERARLDPEGIKVPVL